MEFFKPEYGLIAELKHSINEGQWIQNELTSLRQKILRRHSNCKMSQYGGIAATAVGTIGALGGIILPPVALAFAGLAAGGATTAASARVADKTTQESSSKRFEFLQGRVKLAESRVTSLCERIYGIDPKTVPKVVATKDPLLPALTYEAGVEATSDTPAEGGVHKSLQGCATATLYPPQDGTTNDQVKAATTKEGFVKIEQDVPPENKSELLQSSTNAAPTNEPARLETSGERVGSSLPKFDVQKWFQSNYQKTLDFMNTSRDLPPLISEIDELAFQLSFQIKMAEKLLADVSATVEPI